MPEWTKELLGRKPEEFEKLNESTYIQRRNIRENEDEEIGGWICESRKISDVEYNDIIRSEKLQADIDFIAMEAGIDLDQE